MTHDGDDWRAAAVAEAQRMLASTAGAQAGQKVHMSVDQFRILARLLHDVAVAPAPMPATLPDAAPPAHESTFDAPIDGMRFWVPLPQVEAERRELAMLRERVRAAA